MTLPFEPRLNPPDDSPEMALERQEDARKLLSYMLVNACNHGIQAFAMIASDDNEPDQEMTWGYAQAQLLAIEKALQDVKTLVKTWTTTSAEQLHWARQLKEIEDRDCD